MTGEAIGEVARNEVEKVKVNNGRRVLRTLIGQMTLMSDDRRTRLAAAQSAARRQSRQSRIAGGGARRRDRRQIGALMAAAKAAIVLKTDAASRRSARRRQLVAARGGRDAINTLTAALANAPEELKPAIESALAALGNTQAVWGVAQNVWYGISLGSVLLLAAIGLAITFGVMGVINMAHGEMVMLGAYTTFVVQEVIRQNFRPVRLVAGHRHSARLPHHRPDRRRHRARHHPLALRPRAGNAARHLGPVAHHPAGGTHHLRRHQPRGRQSELDVGRLELGGLTITWNRF